MENIFWCKNCLNASTRPRITFDKRGWCNACQWMEQKKKLDWKKRETELIKILDKYRTGSSKFDCVVPVSGGKDGSYVAYTLKKKYGMNPLAINVTPPLPLEIGEKNINNFSKSGFDLLRLYLNKDVMMFLNKAGFKYKGFPYFGWLIAIQSAVIKTAANFDISVIFYGEDGEIEYGGSTETKNNSLISIDYQKYKDHFLDWLAYQLQHPGEKIRHALILVSTQFQVGKGSIWRAIKLMFGSHNAREIDVGQALDKSKGYLTNSQIVLIDEMQSAGKFDEKTALLNNLKRIITEEHISSRALYIDYKIVKSCTNYLLFTNHKDALSLPNNEVRYWVYISEQSRLNDKFYADYHSWLDNGGAGAILQSLLDREISEDFKPKGVAPDTPFRQVMSKGGEHPLTKIVRQLFEEQEYPFGEKQIIIGSMELYKALKSKGMLKNGRINDVANALESIGGRLLGQCRVKIDNKETKPTLYLIRELDKYFGIQPQKLADELYFPIPPEEDLDTKMSNLQKGGDHF